MSGPDSSTETIHSQYSASIARLGCSPDLYYQHRRDPQRTMKDVMNDLKAMHAEGKFKYVGLSECTPNELRESHAVFPISCVQMEWSLAERGIEKALVPVCKELGVGIVPYSPLARGLLSARVAGKADLDAADRRLALPRFADDALERYGARAARLAAAAAARGCTPAQLALAWLLAQGPAVVPIPGSKAPARVEENMAAIALAARLTPQDIAEVEALDLQAEGARYPPGLMAMSYETRM